MMFARQRRHYLIAGLICCLGCISANIWAGEIVIVDEDGKSQAYEPGSVKADLTPQLTTNTGNLDFNLIFDDVTEATGFGFDDPVLGETRRNTALAAANYLGSIIDFNVTLDAQFRASVDDGGSNKPLSSTSGIFFFNDQTEFVNGIAFDHAMSGNDPSVDFPDVITRIDFGFNFNSGTGAPAMDEYDLFSVVLKSLIRGFGIISASSADGTSTITGNNGTIYTFWDSHLVTGNGKSLFVGGVGFNGVPSDLTGGDGGVFFVGNDSQVAYGPGFPSVLVTEPFRAGASLGNWDDNTFPPGRPVFLLNLNLGESHRALTALDLGGLSDIGWPVIMNPPTTFTDLLRYLLGFDTATIGRDVNSDSNIDVADLVDHLN